MSRLALVALSAAIALGTGIASGSTGESLGARASRPVAFVPLGAFPQAEAKALARSLGRATGLPMRVLPPTAVPRSTYNPSRKQHVSEELIDVVAAQRRVAGANEVLIGLTTLDMHPRNVPTYRFTFTTWHPSGLAVVSRARMDPAALGLAPDPALRTRRLRKMVLKLVGVLALGMSQNRNPRSALYDVILSADDLDFMTEEFKPRSPSRARQTWLDRAGDVCDRGVVEAKALIARSPVATPTEVVAFARESIALEARNRAQLAALNPAPEDRAAVKSLLALFAKTVSTDRAAVAKLEARWSEATLGAWVRASFRNSLALKSRALELGSRECGRYFEPATYVR